MKNRKQQDKLTICVIAGMIDAKLRSKILPIQSGAQVKRIHLVRRQPYTDEKIRCHSPPRLIRGFLPLAECWRLMSLLWICIRHRPDAIVAMGTVPHGIYAWWFGTLFRIPVIQHVMGKNDLRLTFPGQSFRKLTLRAVSAGRHIGVRGQYGVDYLHNHGVPMEKIFVPQNLHDFNLFKPDPAIPKQYDFIYVGLLSPYKRIDLMLDAMAIALQTRPELSLLVVGDGKQREALQQQLSRLGIESAVTLYGVADFQSLPALFSQARSFIMTSQGEGLPMAMIEAMSCGLPVIVPDDADICDMAKDSINATVVSDFTAGGFARAMLAIQEPALHARLVEGALEIRESKLQEYSLEYQTALWERYLLSATGRLPAPDPEPGPESDPESGTQS